MVEQRGLQGPSAESLMYAQAEPARGQAPQEHVSAPALVDVLNSAFQAGRGPGCCQ